MPTPPRAAVALLLSTLAAPALAHPGHGLAAGFVGGLFHPLLGPDHMLAMVALGAWSALLGGRAAFALPALFLAVLAAGAVLAAAGVALPAVEPAIGASVLALGALLALRARPAPWLAAVLAGGFALFHGHAHGIAAPDGGSLAGWCIGFVIASALLHLAGAGLGVHAARRGRLPALRLGGGAIALGGLGFIASTM